MAEVWFYHLERRSATQELPGLLQRGLERGLTMAVLTPSPDLCGTVSERLWAHEGVAFIPHGFNSDGTAARQPIVLLSEGVPLNSARFLFCVDGAEPGDAEHYERVTILFDGTDDQRLSQARGLWKRFKTDGCAIRYWKQDESGRWVDQAAG